MHRLRCASPCSALRAFVRTYAEREFHDYARPILQPATASLEPIINFEFRDQIAVVFNDGRRESHSSSVVGPQTERRAHVLLSGDMHSFAVYFQPSGLSALFGVPMPELSNQAYEASSVLGEWIRDVHTRLAELSCFGLRVRVIEEVLLRYAAKVRTSDLISDTADRLLACRGAVSIMNTATAYGLSLRQFERTFKRTVGISPKLHARIARFSSALDAKITSPSRTWLDIAHDLHFYDQMHMIHDFRDLAGDTPGGVLAQLRDLRPTAMLLRGELHDV
jgi:AraC-like DNA-binding protein